MSRETEHLRHEIEDTRERMSDTLDQLGDRLNPNRIKRQVKDNIREATVGRVENMARHAADRVNGTRDGLLDTIRETPVPAAMIGIGLGWILFSGRRSHSHSHAHDLQADNLTGFAGTGYVGDVSATTPRLIQDDAAGGVGASISHDADTGVIDRVRDRVSDVREGASEMIDTGRERLSDVSTRVTEKVSDVGSRVGGVAHRARHAVSDVAGSTRYQAQRFEDRFQRTLQDNPLAVGAVALAVGMATGFAIPESRREAEAFGPTRDRLADRASELIGEAKERAREVADRVVDEVASGTGSHNSTDSTGTML